MSAGAAERPLSQKLAALGQRIVTAKAQVRERELEKNAVAREVASVREQIVEAHAEGDSAKAASLSKKRTKLEQTGVREADERLEGARLALSRAEADQGMFARDNFDGLIVERAPDAAAVQVAFEDALQGLVRAERVWQAMAADVMALQRMAGRNTHATPSLPGPLVDLVRQVNRTSERVEVPAPIPLPERPRPGGEGFVSAPAFNGDAEAA